MFNPIEEYLMTHFPIETYSELQRAFRVFEIYNFNDYKPLLENIINQESLIEKSELPLLLKDAIIDCLDAILEEHGIKVKQDITLMNDLLISLDTLQHLEDYTLVSNLLLSSENNIDLLADVLEYVSTNTSIYYMDNLISVSDELINNLKNIISSEKDDDMDIDPEIITRFKRFEEVINHQITIGSVLLKSGVRPGLPLMYYLRLVEKHLINSHDTGKDILSIILLTNEGSKNPTLVFKENEERLVIYAEDLSEQVIGIVSKL